MHGIVDSSDCPLFFLRASSSDLAGYLVTCRREQSDSGDRRRSNQNGSCRFQANSDSRRTLWRSIKARGERHCCMQNKWRVAGFMDRFI